MGALYSKYLHAVFFSFVSNKFWFVKMKDDLPKQFERSVSAESHGGSQGAAFVYNITFSIENSIAENWLQWMINEHIPEVMNTGCFIGHRILRLLETNETDGPTYAIQYHAASKADYNRYISLHAEALRKKGFDKWGNQFIAFRSVMEVVR